MPEPVIAKTGKRGGDRGGRRPKIGPPHTIHIETDLWDWVKQEAKQQGIPAAEFARRILRRAEIDARIIT